MALDVEVVSAERRTWSGPARSVVVRTTEGEIGFLPGHEPFLAGLVPSLVKVTAEDGESVALVIDGGFVSVSDDRVSVLTQYARVTSEVDLGQANAVIERLQGRLDARQELSEDEQNLLNLARAEVKFLSGSTDLVR